MSNSPSAASANVVNVDLMDTSDPTNPKIVHTTQCPGCLHTHEARFTPDGKRLIVNDEYIASASCPGGLMYFYDLTGDVSAPVAQLTGAYFPTWFDASHTVVWQTVVILFSVLLWILWANRLGAPREPAHQ